VRRGADAAAVARRIGGPAATVAPAYRDRRPRENVRIAVINRTFLVGVPAGEEDAALRRAESDPDVERADRVDK